jgi:hypothetical protein
MSRPRTRIEAICQQCGITFFRWSLGKKGKGKFCSTACHLAARQTPLVDFIRSRIRIDEATGCHLWTGDATTAGYGLVGKRLVGDGTRYAHRIVWEMANGPIPDGLMICHNCPTGDNPRCVNTAHLFLGTQTDNMQDASKKRRLRYGTGRSNAKLNDLLVKWMRERYAVGDISTQKIADEVGVTYATAYLAIHKKTWQHVV